MATGAPSISVIIPTKGRPRELIECIRSIMAQSVEPSEIVVVDGSATGETFSTLQQAFGECPRLRYVRSEQPSYLTRDRNIGVRNSSGEIVIFVDDDTILDRDFIKEIAAVFEANASKSVGGVMGQIVNATGRPKLLDSLIREIFLLPKIGDGKFRASGSPTYAQAGDTIRDVEFLSGCCMAYRRQVFKDFQFDEGFLEAHLYTDDEDFSYRVSRKYRNLYTPFARLVHDRSTVGRSDNYTVMRMTILGRHYMLTKNFPISPKYITAFWWSVIGWIVRALVFRDTATAKGAVYAIRTITGNYGESKSRG